MLSRHRRAISSRRVSSSQICSRPLFTFLARPAADNALRCLVIACRVTPAPSLRRVIDSGPSAHSRATIWRRVWSPSAANTGALSCSRAAAALRPRDMALNVLDLFGPAAFVHAERFGAARQRDFVEPGLHYREARTARHVLQRELDERHRLRAVVNLRIARMPAI